VHKTCQKFSENSAVTLMYHYSIVVIANLPCLEKAGRIAPTPSV
jgi:hypothetical protein